MAFADEWGRALVGQGSLRARARAATLPPMAPRDEMQRLIEIMARLRDPSGGCPWDVEQDFASIAPYTIEEAYEVDDAIRRGDRAALREELGDLLLQVVFHARMAEEEGAFAFEDVAREICDKLVRRHPHVFGDAVVESAAAQTVAWEDHKAAERAARARGTGAEASALDGVPASLPALMRAQKLVRRAARAGVLAPLPSPGQALAALEREAAAAAPPPERVQAALGALLEACVARANELGVDAEHALRDASARLEHAARARESRRARGED